METTEVYNRFSGNLKNYVVSKVKNAYEADDIIQEVFIRVHKNIGKIHSEDRLASWLFTITRNVITDYFRLNKRKWSDVEAMDVVQQEAEEVIADFQLCLHPFIQKLPTIYREVIVLNELEGMAQKKIAMKLNLNYSTVKSRIQRGRELLKSYFIACCQLRTDRYGNIQSSFTEMNCRNCA